MDIKYFKNVDFNSDYLETTIEFQNREIQLDINSDAVLGKNSWVKEYGNCRFGCLVRDSHHLRFLADDAEPCGSR